MITDEEALKAFLLKTDVPRERVSASAFSEAYMDAVSSQQGPTKYARALESMVEWYQDECVNIACGTSWEPLRVFQTFRHARTWVIFLARSVQP